MEETLVSFEVAKLAKEKGFAKPSYFRSLLCIILLPLRCDALRSVGDDGGVTILRYGNVILRI